MTANENLKDAFWQAFSDSPFVMLELDGSPQRAAPMTAQLDPAAHGAIWFFTTRSGHFSGLGDAWATFIAKDHDVFARFSGNLVEEKSEAIKDKFWSNAIEAWFPGGKQSPDVLLMRMELGEAHIWGADLGFVGTLKLMLGMDVHKEAAQKLETHL